MIQCGTILLSLRRCAIKRRYANIRRPMTAEHGQKPIG
jgi:hypothetical protein